MKNVVLLFLVFTTMTAGAQGSHNVAAYYPQNDLLPVKKQVHGGALINPGSSLTNARTTTVGGSRWYSYVDDILANQSSVTTISATGVILWNDTSAIYGTSTTYYINTWTSMGLSFDPYLTGINNKWNDSTLHPHVIKISATDAYSVDSVRINGSYSRSSDPSKTGVVDTLRLGFVYGTGAGTTNLGTFYFDDYNTTTLTNDHTKFPYTDYLVDTLFFIDMAHDSLHNCADTAGGPSVLKCSIPLHGTDSASIFGAKSFPLMNASGTPVTFAVPAANYMSMSLSFISGDNTFPAYPLQDTIFYQDGTDKYHNFIASVAYSGTSTAVAFPPYSVKDQNNGFFKREGYGDGNGWAGSYIPNWAWTSNTPPGSASVLQYPYIMYHVTCTTCALTSLMPNGVSAVDKNIVSVNAYPNPANNELNISFALGNRADVSVSLTNVLGQVIETEHMENVLTGKAQINTSSLPSGIYIYTVFANGAQSVGRVFIAH